MNNDLYLYWWNIRPNIGDAVSPYLAQKLTTRNVKHYTEAPPNSHVYFSVGSVLLSSDFNSIVWGTGFMMEIRFEAIKPQKPFKILAVRGPLTRAELLKYDIDCPETYGDPGLLLPRFYKPKVDVKYKLGIIPHFVDEDDPWLRRHENDDDLLILSVADPVELFINKLTSCERVISSSLHGIITADAYQVPNLWIKFSDKVAGGHDFKFHDYFISVSKEKRELLVMKEDTSFFEIIQATKLHQIELDLNKLLKVCPYE